MTDTEKILTALSAQDGIDDCNEQTIFVAQQLAELGPVAILRALRIAYLMGQAELAHATEILLRGIGKRTGQDISNLATL